jgi:hypothetical protein
MDPSQGAESSFQDISEASVASSSGDILVVRAKAVDLDQYSRIANPESGEVVRHSKGGIYRYCVQSNCLYSSYNTTNFRNHLRAQHGIIATAVAPKIKQMATKQLQDILSTDSSTRKEIKRSLFQSFLNDSQSAIREAIVRLIVVHSLSLRLIEWPEFHTILYLINPEIKESSCLPTSHNTIKADILKSWHTQREIVQRDLHVAVSPINLSLDIWTSPNNYLLLGVVAHFLRINDSQISKALIGLREVGSHAGEEQAKTLIQILLDFQIINRLGVIIGDNSGTNDTLCRSISSWRIQNLPEQPEWDPEIQRTRCIGHIINLIVQAFLFTSISVEDLETYDRGDQEGGVEPSPIEQQTTKEKFRSMGPLGKLHNITVFIRSSANRTQEFVKEAGKRIPLDNRTRWNSWFNMINTALTLEKHIDFLVKTQPELQRDSLGASDWDWLRTVHGFLKLMADLTLQNEGDERNLSEVLPTLQIIKYQALALKEKIKVRDTL